MHRPTVGLVALVLLLSGVAIEVWGPDKAFYFELKAAFYRVGAVVSVIWLALPDARRGNNALVLMMIIACAVVLVVKAKLIPLVLLFFGAYALLRPRKNSGTASNKS